MKIVNTKKSEKQEESRKGKKIHTPTSKGLWRSGEITICRLLALQSSSLSAIVGLLVSANGSKSCKTKKNEKKSLNKISDSPMRITIPKQLRVTKNSQLSKKIEKENTHTHKAGFSSVLNCNNIAQTYTKQLI